MYTTNVLETKQRHSVTEHEPVRTSKLLIHKIKIKHVTEGTTTIPANSLKLCTKTEKLMPIK